MLHWSVILISRNTDRNVMASLYELDPMYDVHAWLLDFSDGPVSSYSPDSFSVRLWSFASCR
jgi:hypothetical protein